MVAAVASGWSEHTSTSASRVASRSASVPAGRWWPAAATMASGSGHLQGGRHRPARRGEGRERLSLPDERVGHRHHHLARQRL